MSSGGYYCVDSSGLRKVQSDSKGESAVSCGPGGSGATLTVSGGNNHKITLANGVPLYLYDVRSYWTNYSNLPGYLIGTQGTDKVNGTPVTLTLSAPTTCYLLRDKNW